MAENNSNILVVDDNPDNLRLLTGLLNDHNFKVRLASNGKRALATIRKDMPDLIVIDGGKGQLKFAIDELRKLELRIPIISIAKRFEEIYVPGMRIPIRLDHKTVALRFIQEIRDEAHRFAINYHRQLRLKKSFDTDLRDIKGIGPVKEKFLFKKFDNMKRIKRASLDKLIKEGLDPGSAKAVVAYFKRG